jgi:isopenicillin N synthase-like dioxygenase
MAGVAMTPPPTGVKAPSVFTMEQVRENQEDLMRRINGAVFAPNSETIPLIDIGPSFGNDERAKMAVAAEIGKACRQIGFFQITNHGVNLSARQGIMQQARRFFHELPREKKEAIHVKYSHLFRGWEPTDFSNVNPDDWKEGDDVSCETKDIFNWGYEAALDPTGGDGKYVEMDLEPSPAKGANMWPDEEDLPGFFSAVQVYHKQACLSRLFPLYSS